MGRAQKSTIKEIESDLGTSVYNNSYHHYVTLFSLTVLEFEEGQSTPPLTVLFGRHDEALIRDGRIEGSGAALLLTAYAVC